MGKLSGLVLTLGLMAASLPALAAPRADVLVRPSSEVAGGEVMLGDLASVKCADDAVAERLRNVPICPSPLPGRMRQITREQIVIALRRQGISDDAASVICPRQASVTRASRTVSGQALFETAQEFVLAGNSWQGKVAVEPVRLPPNQTVPAGKLELRVRPDTRKPKKGRNNLPVEIVVDGQVYSTAHVSVEVRVVAPVLVATQSIARSSEITAANSILQERDITNLPDEVVMQAPTGSAIAAVPIAEGAAIRQSWVSEPLAIRSGDSVTVVVSSRCVRVSDKGTAAADGRPGDRIKVRLTGDVREIRGTVVRPGLVEIRISGRS